MPNKESGLVYAFAVGLPSLLDFHLYSAYLSSPWTTEKLAEDDPEMIPVVWRLFAEATIAAFILTTITGAILAKALHSALPLLVSYLSFAFGAIWMGVEYWRATQRSV